MRLPKFPAEMERAFQEDYYLKVRSMLRSSLIFMAGLNVLLALFAVLDSQLPPFDSSPAKVVVFFALAVINLLLFGLSFRRNFAALWQPLVVVTTLSSLVGPLITGSYTASAAVICFLILIASRVQQLQFRWTALSIVGVLLVGLSAALGGFLGKWFGLSAAAKHADPQWAGEDVAAMVCVVLALVSFSLISTFKKERFQRSEFLTKYQLSEERNEERQKREQTEKMLHILSQAIGGIVHDLGNPLTAVQGGAQTLLEFAKEGEPDKETVQEFAEMIDEGAQMLNYLRLSLMEQIRVLEGKPTPVELAPASIRHIVESSTHYQKPRFAAGRAITLQGDDMEVCVDEMRFITVFMNLIGNALKYSDGQVRVTWCTQGEHVLIAVQDQGRKGQGISKAQAEKLFVPFGRLDTHAQIEGTGLGLLSVRKIAEAHDGEVYIEGTISGTGDSAIFSTAQGSYPRMLEDDFRTAFVTTCPQKVMSHQKELSAMPIVQQRELA